MSTLREQGFSPAMSKDTVETVEVHTGSLDHIVQQTSAVLDIIDNPDEEGNVNLTLIRSYVNEMNLHAAGTTMIDRATTHTVPMREGVDGNGDGKTGGAETAIPSDVEAAAKARKKELEPFKWMNGAEHASGGVNVAKAGKGGATATRNWPPTLVSRVARHVLTLRGASRSGGPLGAVLISHE